MTPIKLLQNNLFMHRVATDLHATFCKTFITLAIYDISSPLEKKWKQTPDNQERTY